MSGTNSISGFAKTGSRSSATGSPLVHNTKAGKSERTRPGWTDTDSDSDSDLDSSSASDMDPESGCREQPTGGKTTCVIAFVLILCCVVAAVFGVRACLGKDDDTQASPLAPVALKIVGDGELPVLPTEEWPFDHAAVLANMEVGDKKIVVLQQNLGNIDLFDKQQMNTYDAGEQDAEIRATRMKMDLYMALYGWPRLLVKMMNSKFKTMMKDEAKEASPFDTTNREVAGHVDKYFTDLRTTSKCDDVLEAAQAEADNFQKEKWEKCAKAILRTEPEKTLKDLSQIHVGFWKNTLETKVLKEVKVMQHWNQNSNGQRTKIVRFSFDNYFFPNLDEMQVFQAFAKNGANGSVAVATSTWMDTRCGEVNPEAYAKQQRLNLEQFRTEKTHNAQRTFDEEIQFLALFDFHLYRSLLCSNEAGKSLQEIFVKTSKEQKTAVLDRLVKRATPDLVFTQEYHAEYSKSLQESGYRKSTGREKGAVVHWNSNKLYCQDVSEDIEGEVKIQFAERTLELERGASSSHAAEKEKGKSLDEKLRDEKFKEKRNKSLDEKFQEKLNFVECQKKRDEIHTKFDAAHEETFLAVSFHGASNTSNDEGNFGKIGKDQLWLLHEILELVEQKRTYSSIIVGADANQKLNESATWKGKNWVSSSLDVWTKTSGNDVDKYQTVNKTRSFMQHQYAKAGEEDKKGKDHVLVYNSKNVQMTMKSAEIVYGFA
jgi:hypothetical protein